MPEKDSRLQLLSHWLESELGLSWQTLSLASSDASFRRYFRVQQQERSLIVMDAPPERENVAAFIKVAAIMRSVGVNVPEIYEINLDQGLLLLEDFGGQNYLDILTPANAEALYQDATRQLLKLQRDLSLAELDLPVYDQAFVERELGIFYEWFVEAYLGIDMPASLIKQLNLLLTENVLSQPQVCMHRDFHSRNLMVSAQDNPGVIDFQDAVIGPISYDLVSLYRDCYIQWPEAKIESWRQAYWEQLVANGFPRLSASDFARYFDLTGFQRHLKAIGIFARLHLRDAKSGYLGDIPRTLSYVSSIAASYPELKAFHQFLQEQVLPSYTGKNS